MRFTRISAAVALLSIGVLSLSRRLWAAPKLSDTVVVVQVDSEITLGLAAYVRRALDNAKGAKGVVIRIDTFGGRVDAALDISRAVESAGPVFAWVDDKAWSAGALIALSCPRIYMRKGSSIGSAAPVGIDSSGAAHPLGEKYISALRAKFMALAEKNGYPPLLAAAMVDHDVAVVRVKREEGPSNFITPEEAERLAAQDELDGSTETVSAKGKLLNLSADRAVDYGLAKPAATLEEAVKAQGWAGATLVTATPTPADRLANFLTQTEVAGVLTMLGFMLISFELNVPGHIVPGILGAACLALVYFGHYFAYIASWFDLFLVLVGLGLIALEVFHFPGMGLAAVPGAALVAAGIYLMLVPFVVPTQPWDFERLHQVRWVLGAAFFGMLAGFFSVIVFLTRRQIFQRKGAPGQEATAPADNPKSGELLPGQRGLSVTPLAPGGRAQFGIHLVEVRSESPIAKGAPIEIVSMEGGILVRAVRH
jgi:membrane-bound serine protease (ClpP class)